MKEDLKLGKITLLYGHIDIKSFKDDLKYITFDVSISEKRNLYIFEYHKKLNIENPTKYWKDYILTQKDTGHNYKSSLYYTEFEATRIENLIKSGLSLKEGSIFYIPYPENMKHPLIVKKLMDFLIMLAECGVKVVIRTYSMNLITSVRYAIFKEKMLCDDVYIYYGDSENFERIELVKRNAGYKNGKFPFEEILGPYKELYEMSGIL